MTEEQLINELMSTAARDLCEELTRDGWPDWLVSVGFSDKELFVYYKTDNPLICYITPVYYYGYVVNKINVGEIKTR